MKELVGLTQVSNQSIVNVTTAYTRTCSLEYHTSARVFFMVAYSLVFVVGFLLNCFILKFYFCQPQRSSRTIMVYLKNLTAADFLLTLSLLFDIINSTNSSMTFHLAYCNFGSTIFYVNMYASMLFMAYIAYNRYLKIVHPLKPSPLQSVPAACVISTVTWIFFIAVSIIYSSMSYTDETRQNSTYVLYSCECLRSVNTTVLYKIIHTCTLAIFLSILILMVCVYYRSSRTLTEAQRSQLTFSNTEKLAKACRNMKVLVSVFCVCFAPFHLVDLPCVLLGCLQTPKLHFLQQLSLVLSALNVCLDPFIYFIFCKDFQKQLKNMFCRDKQTSNNERGISQSQLNVIIAN